MIESLSARARRTFVSLTVPNFRFYISGQLVSLSGTWMQRVAQAWLVLELTGSGTSVGAVTSLQFLPILLLAPFGGVFADRFDKRRILITTQALAGMLALTLGVLVLTDHVQLWMVYLLALSLGIVGSFDNPARHSFVFEMVGRAKVSNAVGLHSMLMSTARVFGPALAGFLIVAVGIGACFVINAASYGAVLLALLVMDEEALYKTPPQEREPGQFRESLRYVRSDQRLLIPLLMSATVGLFSHEFEVILPLLARFTFEGGADTLGLMFAAMGIGSLVGGLYVASEERHRADGLAHSAIFLALTIAVAAVAPTLWSEVAVLGLVGAASTSFSIRGNSILQLAAQPRFRGRVLALRAVAFLGARPIGAPIVGWIGEHVGPRHAVGLGALTAMAIGIWGKSKLSGLTVLPGDPADNEQSGGWPTQSE